MDIKLKNFKNKYYISGIIILIIMALSIVMCSLYGRIDDIAKNNNNGIRYEYIQNDLYRSNFVLNKLLIEKETGKPVNYNDLYLIEKEKKSSDILEQIEMEFKKFEGRLNDEFKNLDYLILNNKNSKKITNTEQDLSLFINNSVKDKELLLNYYSYYTIIEFDSEGSSIIKNTNQYVYNYNEYYNNYNVEIKKHLGLSIEEEINSPKDVTIIYGIPKTLTYFDDDIYYNSLNVEYWAYGDIMIPYVMVMYIIIILISLVIPYRKFKEDKIIGKLLNIPFEILVTIVLTVTMFIGLSPQIIYGTLYNSDIIEGLKIYGISEVISKFGLDVANVVYWMTLFFTVFIAISLFKYIFGEGIIKYLKENTLVGRIIRFISIKSKKVFENLSKIDFKEDSNKYILKVVGINFVIVSICCVFWFAGLFGTIVYSIVLFFILRKYVIEIKEKYNILLEATNKIAEGNLDVEIKEDLKVFEPVKKELEKIQKGFKKAVEEEVKSQKMKTDLITNVSHDLKTPLTSIVTYVDLLKDENLTEENRKLYIETIEKKAERLKSLIEDLFEMSKATSNSINLNIIDVDLIELIKQTEIELSDKIKASGLNIKWINKEDKIIIPLDSQKTFRIFENLLTNAIKYSMENSRIYIEVKKEEEYATVVIKNISKLEINFNTEEIVERFQRGDKSRNTEGSGLGLAIAKSFVEIQGGLFNIETDGDLFKVKMEFKINK
ncbi:HAMP domain-containing sensor histidine kinase [Clostridium sp.]|uniref:sensor histidine kinase n=1 Tax=Clostridium sp. TaxID=1506 RepID=UPI002634D15A|nr:HAMP domain-containing sensor histidine kinase [Clostridium sp.]